MPCFTDVDIFVATETSAGWCNTAAEASASGVPCVVTPARTIDFAEHTNTALVLEAPDPDAIADAVGRLARHPSSMSGIAQRAVVRMRRHSWHDYTRALLDLMDRPRLGA